MPGEGSCPLRGLCKDQGPDCVPEADRAKFMDDLTILEVIVLENVGMASHNIRVNIPTNIANHNQFIPSEHLKTQEYLKTIDNWTEALKMRSLKL